MLNSQKYCSPYETLRPEHLLEMQNSNFSKNKLFKSIVQQETKKSSFIQKNQNSQSNKKQSQSPLTRYQNIQSNSPDSQNEDNSGEKKIFQKNLQKLNFQEKNVKKSPNNSKQISADMEKEEFLQNRNSILEQCKMNDKDVREFKNRGIQNQSTVTKSIYEFMRSSKQGSPKGYKIEKKQNQARSLEKINHRYEECSIFSTINKQKEEILRKKNSEEKFQRVNQLQIKKKTQFDSRYFLVNSQKDADSAKDSPKYDNNYSNSPILSSKLENRQLQSTKSSKNDQFDLQKFLNQTKNHHNIYRKIVMKTEESKDQLSISPREKLLQQNQVRKIICQNSGKSKDQEKSSPQNSTASSGGLNIRSSSADQQNISTKSNKKMIKNNIQAIQNLKQKTKSISINSNQQQQQFSHKKNHEKNMSNQEKQRERVKTSEDNLDKFVKNQLSRIYEDENSNNQNISDLKQRYFKIEPGKNFRNSRSQPRQSCIPNVQTPFQFVPFESNTLKTPKRESSRSKIKTINPYQDEFLLEQKIQDSPKIQQQQIQQRNDYFNNQENLQINIRKSNNLQQILDKVQQLEQKKKLDKEGNQREDSLRDCSFLVEKTNNFLQEDPSLQFGGDKISQIQDESRASVASITDDLRLLNQENLKKNYRINANINLQSYSRNRSPIQAKMEKSQRSGSPNLDQIQRRIQKKIDETSQDKSSQNSGRNDLILQSLSKQIMQINSNTSSSISKKVRKGAFPMDFFANDKKSINANKVHLTKQNIIRSQSPHSVANNQEKFLNNNLIQ